MNIRICARGFALTEALRTAVTREARHFARRLGGAPAEVAVQVYKINATRGGVDKACLVRTHLAGLGPPLVASDVDADLYRAIAGAFARLGRAVGHARSRRTATRRRATLRSMAGE